MEDDGGVMSIGSRGGGASVDADEGRMGMAFWWRFELCDSAENGERRASATEVMADEWGLTVLRLLRY
jgi:hypothetical protein